MRHRKTFGMLAILLAAGFVPGFFSAQQLAAQEEQTSAPVSQSAPAAAAPAADVYADIPGTRVSLHVPLGFELSTSFPGIVHQGFEAMVVTTEFPAPLEKITEQMREQSAAPDGPKWDRSEKVKVSGMDATMYHSTEDDADGAVRKWIVLLGTEKVTVMLAASAPALLEPAVGKTIEECLLTAKWDPNKKVDAYAGLGFTLRDSDVFEVRGRRPGGVLLTRKDAPDELTPAEPILVVYPTVSPEISPLAVLAKQQLADGDQFVEFANFAERTLTINGLNGYEIIADAKEASHSIPVRIILMVVRTPDQDMVIEGIVQPDSWEKYVGEFHALAESFKVTPASHGH